MFSVFLFVASVAFVVLIVYVINLILEWRDVNVSDFWLTVRFTIGTAVAILSVWWTLARLNVTDIKLDNVYREIRAHRTYVNQHLYAQRVAIMTLQQPMLGRSLTHYLPEIYSYESEFFKSVMQPGE